MVCNTPSAVAGAGEGGAGLAPVEWERWEGPWARTQGPRQEQLRRFAKNTDVHPWGLLNQNLWTGGPRPQFSTWPHTETQ